MANPFTIAEELPYTMLSLNQYAKYMSINPVHFMGAIGEEVFPIGSNACNDLFPHHSWQSGDRVSHESILYEIEDVETEISKVLGYYPLPVWVAQEAHPYPMFYRRDVWATNGRDVTLRKNAIQTDFRKVISPGQRAVSLVGTATVAGGTLVYSDADGDGFTETATITLPTSLTNVCQLKVYFANTEGAQEWEIRPARKKSISGGSVTFVFPSWYFIDPDILSRYPTTESFRGINLETTANYVTSVDVYREYNDPTQTSARFFWEPEPNTANGFCTSCGGSGCTTCQLTYQDGCLHIRDAVTGMVVPSTATYDSTNGVWNSDCWTVCRNPDEVTLWYYAGDLDNKNLRGDTCREMKGRLGRVIAYMATARLERPFCSCNVVTALSQDLRKDLALAGDESYQVSEADLDNPFGTRKGEVMAWKYIQNVAKQVWTGVAV